MNLENILKMSQKELKNALAKELQQMKYPVTTQKGFVYAKGDVPVMLVVPLPPNVVPGAKLEEM